MTIQIHIPEAVTYFAQIAAIAWLFIGVLNLLAITQIHFKEGGNVTKEFYKDTDGGWAFYVGILVLPIVVITYSPISMFINSGEWEQSN